MPLFLIKTTLLSHLNISTLKIWSQILNIQKLLFVKKINPTFEELTNRGLLHIAIHKKEILNDTEFVRLDSSVFRVPIESPPSNDLNFNIDDYSNFLKTLELHNNMCGSFVIDNGEISQSFHSRGRKMRKYKRSKSKKSHKK